ncbi:MAG: Ger(x)C family spore germination protein [Bacillota bacterium]|nr:Ger(x)C family spore germination protein [Bacillota bacterium]
MKKKFKVVGFSVILIMCCNLITACWDKVELEEEGYVAAIGIDFAQNPQLLRITFQITNPKAVAGGGTEAGSSGGAGEKRSEIVSMDAPGILAARDLVSITSTRRISLAHSKVFIVSEELAKSTRFFHNIEAALREREMRRAMEFMVVREKAEEFIRNNIPLLEDRPQKFYEFMAKRWVETGFVPPFSNLNRFMQRTEEGGSLFLSIYGTTHKFGGATSNIQGDFLPGESDVRASNNTQMIGAAVFKGGKMIGKLTGYETRLAILLRPKPEVKSFLQSLPDPLSKKDKIAGRLFKNEKTKIKLNLDGKNPVIDVTVPISVDILGITSFINYPEDLEKQKVLKKSIEKYFEEKSRDLVLKTQSVYEGEPFLWELEARKKFLTFDEYNNYDWMKHYAKAKVNINYVVTIKGFGKQLNPPKLKQEKNTQWEE